MTQPMNDAAIRAATLSGFRQGLEQCAQQLRAQTQAWREESLAKQSASLKRPQRLRANAEHREVTAWCSRLEQIASLIEAEARRRITQENEERAKSLQKASVPGVVSRVLAALRTPRKG